jgi:hypothetical protein
MLNKSIFDSISAFIYISVMNYDIIKKKVKSDGLGRQQFQSMFFRGW